MCVGLPQRGFTQNSILVKKKKNYKEGREERWTRGKEVKGKEARKRRPVAKNTRATICNHISL